MGMQRIASRENNCENPDVECMVSGWPKDRVKVGLWRRVFPQCGRLPRI